MALTVRRRGDNGLSAWPGYVDALSTLLMVIIFVLLVFVLAQAFLSVVLSGRDKQLDRVNRQLAQVSDMLSLERSHATDLQQSITQLNQELSASSTARATLSQQLTTVKTQAEQTGADRDALRAERDKLAQQLADAGLQAQSSAARVQHLQSDLSASAAQTDAAHQEVAQLATELAKQKTVGDSATAQIALLNQQVDQLKSQLTSLAQSLDLAKTQGQQKDTQIADLGQKLNVALAEKVEELKGYRSEFFGKLRAVLANQPGIQVVGDRFVIQSEVLFPLNSADLTPAGQNEITALAITIKNIAAEIPPDIKWILRVDGHTDRQPIKAGGSFASNWELSSARAITVVKLLIADGVPPEHLAATGFSYYQPLDPADTPDAYAKNRRIELRLTDR